MKKIWVKIDHWNKEMVIAAIEGGADGLVIPEGYSKQVSKLGKINTIAKDGNLIIDVDVVFVTLKSVLDEDEIVKISNTKIVVVECINWKVIPLENIIAKGGNNIILEIRTLEEAQLAFGILEKGISGVLLSSSNIGFLKKTLYKLVNSHESINLKTALIEDIKHVGMGDRVCIDTCSSMLPGQGVLVGNSSAFLFLMHSESIDNPYVEKRPFRINAGAVHAYTRIPSGKTNYLSELSAGSLVQVINYLGHIENTVIGRIKIEKRPLLLVKAKCDGLIGSTIVQNAETIRLVSSDGVARSIVELEKGDEILVSIEKAGRHFGYKIKEYIDER